MSPSRVLINFAQINLQHRRLVWDLIRRDFKMRYLGSVMGSYWNFIHPLAMITIYTVIFSHIMRVRLGGSGHTSPFAYTIYLCAGMLPWTALQDMVLRGSHQFHEHANFIKKIAFPTEIIQTVMSGSGAISFLISLSIYLLFLLVSGHGWSWPILTLPLLIFLQLAFSAGLGMALGVFNVFLRDVQQLVNIVFQVWFWLTPIVYSLEQAPKLFQRLFALNPFYHFVRCYQEVLVEQKLPSLGHLAFCFFFALASYTLGASILSHFRNQLADEL